MTEITEELQSLVLSSIIKNTYFYSKVNKLLKPQFFSNINYRIILEKVKYHYNKYGNVPTQQALLTYLNDIDDVVDKSSLKLDAINLYAISDDESEEYLIDKITNFIKISNIQDVISSYLPRIKSGEEVSLEKLGTELSRSVDIDMNSQSSLTLSNFQQLEEARKNAIGSNSDPTIIKSSLEPINHALMFGGYKYGDLVAIVSPPGSGKTSILVNEGSAAARQGKEVLHLFIGDMNNYDGWIRYCSCLTNVPQTDLVAMGLEQQIQFIKDYNKTGWMTHITVQDVPAESCTVDQLLKIIKELQRTNKIKYDMIIVDYPENLIGEGDNMYLSSGTIYNKLSGFGAKNRSVMLLASQPKISYYSSEIIPLEGAAESSKKQQNIDLMVTFGKPYRDFPYLTGFIPKCRRGEVGRKFRVKTEFERMHAEEISEVQYHSELNAYLGSQGGN